MEANRDTTSRACVWQPDKHAMTDWKARARECIGDKHGRFTDEVIAHKIAAALERAAAQEITERQIEAAREAYATFGQTGDLRAMPPSVECVRAMLEAAIRSAE